MCIIGQHRPARQLVCYYWYERNKSYGQYVTVNWDLHIYEFGYVPPQLVPPLTGPGGEDSN